MVMCFAPDCKHDSEKQGCRFFVFPKDPNEKKKWITLIRRKDREPSMHSLVCSCHFKDGDRKNGPTIFEHNKLKRFCDEPSTSSGITKPRKLKKQLCDPVISEDQNTAEEISRSHLPEIPTAASSSALPAGEDMNEPSTSKQVSVNVTASTEAENYFLRKELDETKKN